MKKNFKTRVCRVSGEMYVWYELGLDITHVITNIIHTAYAYAFAEKDMWNILNTRHNI